MLIYKMTNTIDNCLPPLSYTEKKDKADVLLVGGKKFCLSEFPRLKGVFKTGVGVDNLPFSDAREKGVEIRLPSESTSDIVFEETAVYTCHLILMGLFKGAGEWDSWHKAPRKALQKKRLLVVGAGRIGSRVAEKMRAFMDVDIFDSAHDAPETFESKVRAADCVSLHVPLTSETRGLFDAERLQWLSDGALLVNTARGPVVDEVALFKELSSGRIRAAFDVFWEEPYRGVLLDVPGDRFMRSPHVASTCGEFIHGTAMDFLNFMDELSNAGKM